MAKTEEQQLTPKEVIATALAMFQEILESRACVRDGTKAERLMLHNNMCDALDHLYRGKEALTKL